VEQHRLQPLDPKGHRHPIAIRRSFGSTERDQRAEIAAAHPETGFLVQLLDTGSDDTLALQRGAQQMPAGLCKSVHDPFQNSAEAVEVYRLRPAERQRTGLVEQRAVDLGQPFQRGSVLDQHA